ncbi:MAG: hypothetical protein UZ21_OP11001000703 [Microgenomates bacterium OLB22]|nr:MAG: hypothetical protein UZ21_OP11001000703 [Microgenomates bacterium OLB22]
MIAILLGWCWLKLQIEDVSELAHLAPLTLGADALVPGTDVAQRLLPAHNVSPPWCVNNVYSI